MLKINFLGDSITQGARASSEEKNYVSLVGKMLNAVSRNYGISGTRIAIQRVPSLKPYHDKYFASRVKDMDKDADLVFVFGGTNDYGHGDADFGNIGDKEPTTFCGAVDDLINELLKYYDQQKIIFILPIHRVNETNPYGSAKTIPGKTLPEYRDAMTTILNNRGIKILDIVEQFGKAEDNPLIADGLHPNDMGHQKLAELIVDYIKSQIKIQDL